MIVEITTDGSSLTNPGPGGWAAVFKVPGHAKALFGFDPQTTNNRMELTAVISALNHLSRPCNVIVNCDSQYVVNGITKWINKWKKNGYSRSKYNPYTQEYNVSGREVANKDLWISLDQARQRHVIQWIWVRGHGTHEDNIMCDRIARQAALKQLSGVRSLDEGYTLELVGKKSIQIPSDVQRSITFE